MLGLRHINLNVRELERSIRFYTCSFDLQELERVVDESAHNYGRSQRLEQAFLGSAATRDLLALSMWEEAPINAGGLDHLGFILESNAELDSILERVRRAGGTLMRSGERESHGITEAFAYVRDPDGYAIELSTQSGAYSLLG